MADRGHELTDEILENLENSIAAEYAEATRDMERKLRAYLEKFEADDAKQKALLAEGKITQQEYQSWSYRHKMMNKRWEEMRDVLAEDMHHTNEIALSIARERMPDVYALNGNYAIYEIEQGGRVNTGLTLYNHDTAEYLLREQRQLMPGPSTRKTAEIAANKDLQWNQKKIQSAVLQGVLQGETPFQVARRLMGVGQMNYNAAVRYARTMTTNAQNAGRYNSYRRAKNLGVDLTIEWQSVLDGRTRHDHRMLHGQRRDVDEPFVTSEGIEILWPANEKCGTSTVPQSMIWNCRCTLRAWVKGFEGNTVKQSPGMDGMSFEEWQNAKPHQQSNISQFKEYQKRLGKYAPGSLLEFERIKYQRPNEWNLLKTEYRWRGLFEKDGLNHKPLQSNSPFRPISDRTFNALVAGAKSQGATIIKGGEWAERHLEKGVRASSIGSWLIFRDEVSKSDVHEELRHFWQWQTGFANDAKDYERTILREIDAKNYLINNRKRLKIPREETLETIRELEAEKRKLELARSMYES